MTRSTPPRSFVYLGWQGYGNFGDDLLHETWRAALRHPLDVEAPLTRRDYARRSPRFVRDRARLIGRERLVLLGGGTTVGFASWAGHVDRATRYFGATGTIGLGLGAAAADDSYSLGTQPQQWDAWRSLDRFALHGVRGPLTEHEVTTNLCPVDVVGDPALLYPELVHVQRTVRPDGRIGVSIGSDPTTRFDVDTIAEAVDRHAAATGTTEVVAFALSGADRMAAHGLAARLRTPAVVHEYIDVPTTMAAIAGCDLVVSERLHGAIAAVSLDVPTVPLSYASKCDDFWRSVTDGPAPLTVGHDVDELVHEMQIATRHRDGIRARTAELRERLGSVQQRLLDWHTAGSPTAELFARTKAHA
ncbi:polysaccharide pyruvyl transferase WcaK-like protein [Curtobacterium sp. PhB25]|uniref:polysaccharide pyruvyl transferase family protein n=1 Tax=unclassified Curtobacterium TaxID=257496 RepID=UPI000F4E503E|nr:MULTISPECIES: polysaccharide pyruvyl transferase family protein [unclassified Curtobacterium]RPE85137.1 polysaccharide pyruvyl transferase WcaK-like protein [Curtobacterium sp. PhB137]TCU82839.1 polysaccharide pyruvyl transferase WcaK-like protein [Curtobacterium sp. PhB191]TDW48279.1 polysaccharide pyruvyl transferase WcaK-like protein [Curtobacterium sp. PhB42]TDW53880.1 polysaccharide pyruvyl transferase WcaK-like protein [Curtobacterium sp. PhB190]TDW68007.1 polysaccharide pyruvyl trans